MNRKELFGVRKLRCPICDNNQMFYVGSYIEDFSENFSVEERTCENCKKHIWSSDMYTILTDGWNINEIVEAISGEFENQNKHSQTDYPLKISKILKEKGVPEYTIRDILIEFFQDILE